ncbi:MAG: hypothetical protein ACK587_01795 [Cyanobacteriota bacterium]
MKMRLADQNVFGVDLNPVAVELAEMSLWLNSIFAPEQGRVFVLWFSQQLQRGNSLIGARRQVYRVSQLPTGTGRKAKPSRLWHEHGPEELARDAALPADAIFHFRLPAPGMVAYSDKVIKELEPEAIERCKRWNKAFVREAFTRTQIAHLLRLSQLEDEIWKQWAQPQSQLGRRTTDPLPVWKSRGAGVRRGHRHRLDTAEAQGPHPGTGGAGPRRGQHQCTPQAAPVEPIASRECKFGQVRTGPLRHRTQWNEAMALWIADVLPAQGSNAETVLEWRVTLAASRLPNK